jgi:N-formylglutamate amidohydrolase
MDNIAFLAIVERKLLGRMVSGLPLTPLRTMSELKDEFDPPFEVLEPAEWRGPVMFNSPHSGNVYPRAFLTASRLELVTLRRSEDSFVDELVLGVVQRGYPLMRAHFPRCYVDVNREPYELDPRMFEGRLPSFANTRSMRVAGGLGTVARVVGDAQEIYSQRIPVDDAIRRIEGLYKPYHRSLRRLFTRVHRDFGAAILIDCHSMPSSAGSKDERPRSDVVLGDRYGTSCIAAVAETADATLRAQGYSVSRNKPYAGGFITEHYGNPAAGLHAIQLELNRALYMDERRFERSPSFGQLAADLETLAENLAAIPLQELHPYRTAAE